MPDKDEVPGSSPGRPTNHPRRSQRCRQRGGNARCQPGPRRGRTPIPAGTPIAPSGPAHPRRQAPRQPRTVVAYPAQDGSHAAAAAPRAAACSVPSRRQPPALRTPAWPAWLLSGHARPSARNPARRLATPTDQRASSPASPAPGLLAVERLGRRRGSPPGPRPVPVVQVARRTGLVLNVTARCGRRRTRPDRRTDTGRLDTGRLDTSRPDRRIPDVEPR
jgi:hypothetical protein